jgi:hypothetical protein
MITQNQIAFSHRPRVGISVGVYVQDGTAYIAAAFQNVMDDFNRKLARTIVTSRLNSRLERDDVRFTHSVDSGEVDARAIMREFRQNFKPSPEETDATFEEISEFGGVETRSANSRDLAWVKLQGFFINAVTSASINASSGL